VTYLVHLCDMIRSFMWHDSFIYVTWFFHLCDMIRSFMWHDSFMCMICVICVMCVMCDMTHSCVLRIWIHSYAYTRWCCMTMLLCGETHLYVWHDSFICVTWLNQMHNMTCSYVWHHSYVWHASFICVTWLIHMRDINYLYVWHDSFICSGMTHSCV